MAKTPQQVILELHERSISNEKRLDILEKITENLTQALETLNSTPPSRRGATVPPTSLPVTLSELELGREPKGA